MTVDPDRVDRLDDPATLAEADPGDMLRQVASSAAQIRRAMVLSADAGVSRLAGEGRPRAIVVTGMGGSGISGDVLAAVCGQGCSIPIVPVRGHRLPGWVGATDLVAAVSCSGSTEETLAAAEEAARRGCRLLMVGGAPSPLADLAVQTRGLFVPVESVGMPRSTLWGLAVPLILAARELGLVRADDAVLEGAAGRLEEVAHRCRPDSESFVNPGKQVAVDLLGSVPMVWGASPEAATAAYRFTCQLNENAKYPGIHGELPEAGHNQIMTLDGFFGRAARPAGDMADFFRDRADDPETGLHLVLLRDVEEHPQVLKRHEVAAEMARARGIPVTELAAEGEHALERIATLIALADYITVYLAIALGVDPSPVPAIQELKARIA